MTIPFQKGRYMARFATGPADVAACQRLRHRCFYGTAGTDADHFDVKCRHLMVHEDGGALVATARLTILAPGGSVMDGYAGQFYDLAPLAKRGGTPAEIGRFCVAPGVANADVLRVGWGALTRLVDDLGLTTLFGCTSFPGVDPARHSASFAALRDRYQGPADLRPGIKAAEVVRFADLPAAPADLRAAPPLLRTYLGMGGWVSDHAVIDHAMNTLHVFTCLDIASVPPARARALRAIAN